MISRKEDRKKWLVARAKTLLLAAVDNDDDTAAAVLAEVGGRYGHGGVFAVCCALCEALRQWVFPNMKRGDGSLTGDMVRFEIDGDAPVDRAILWSARFLAAYCNGDGDTLEALFFAQTGDQQLIIGGVAELVNMAGDIGRIKKAEFDAKPSEEER